MLMIASLVLFGTGLSNVRALMAFHVPRYQKIAGMGWVVAALIALYFQAAKGEGTNADFFVRALFVSFFMAMVVYVFSLGCGAPLKRVINGDGDGDGDDDGGGDGVAVANEGGSPSPTTSSNPIVQGTADPETELGVVQVGAGEEQV